MSNGLPTTHLQATRWSWADVLRLSHLLGPKSFTVQELFMRVTARRSSESFQDEDMTSCPTLPGLLASACPELPCVLLFAEESVAAPKKPPNFVMIKEHCLPHSPPGQYTDHPMGDSRTWAL